MVVHAWHVPVSAYSSASGYGAVPVVFPEPGVYEAADRQTLRAAMSTIHAGAIREGVDERLVEGDPASVIIDTAADADLIVLGGHRRTGLGELLLGSTSRDVARGTTVPIVVVPAVAEVAAAA